MKKQYQGTEKYIVSPELQNVVNTAILLERPLLIKGEPGTGKTLLAYSIAEALGLKLLRWNIKSTTKAVDGLYVYDTVQRLNDARFGGKDVSDIKHYIKLGKLGESFHSSERIILLIDEIDKADIEFPNDLLAELDEMSFYIPETESTITAKHRPIVVITSNNEKELPDAFLRRCIFHFIEFPPKEMMKEILDVHIEDLEEKLLEQALSWFYQIRALNHLRKKPSTSELIDWMKALIKGGLSLEHFKKELPLMGTLIKNEQDMSLLLKSYHV